MEHELEDEAALTHSTLEAISDVWRAEIRSIEHTIFRKRLVALGRILRRRKKSNCIAARRAKVKQETTRIERRDTRPSYPPAISAQEVGSQGPGQEAADWQQFVKLRVISPQGVVVRTYIIRA
jgi:hypothetical protein